MDLVPDDEMSHSFKNNDKEDFAKWEFISVVTLQLFKHFLYVLIAKFIVFILNGVHSFRLIF